MNTQVIKYASIATLILAITGTALYLHKQIQRLTEYCYKFKDVVVRQAGLQKSVVELIMEFTNNSKLDANVYGYSIDIFINNKSVGRIFNDKKMIIGAAKRFFLPIKIEFEPRKILNIDNLWDALQSVEDKNAFVVKFSGNIVVGVVGGLVRKTIAVDKTYTLSEIIKMANAPSSQPAICNY